MSSERKLIRVNAAAEPSGETSFFNPKDHAVGDFVEGTYMGTSERKQINPKYKNSPSNTYQRVRTEEGDLVLIPGSTVLNAEMAKIEKGTFVRIVLSRTYEEAGYYGWEIYREGSADDAVGADDSIEI